MALNLKKRNLKKYDIEVHTDISDSMKTRDCNGVSRYAHAQGWVTRLVQEAEAFDDDGPTVGFFDNETVYFENTTFDKVAGVFKKMGPRGSTDTARLIRERCGDYLNRRLGVAGSKGVLGFGRHAAVPANPSTKPRILVIITDGSPNSQSELEQEIIGVTQRMSAGGLTKDDLVIVFVQVGYAQNAKVFLERLNNGLEKKGATMDIVGCITCDEAMSLSTQQLLERALDAE
ncbi:MAG TPA: hypothetical protein V6C89_00615 [Drouetiella sp.]|jgi:hypothetical protein